MNTLYPNPVVTTLSGVSLLEMCALTMMPSVAIIHSDHIKEKSGDGGNGGMHEITANIAFTYAEAFLKVRTERYPETRGLP